MVSKEDAKKEVKKVIEKYERYKTSGEIKDFIGKEGTTKTTFILPLFKALGWDVDNEKNIEVVSEERVLKGAVDYAFRIIGQNKFFVEAKPIGSELKEHTKQAIEYGVNSGNAWVVLTNFESIIIFNCEWKEKDWWKNALFGQLDYKDYLSNFDMLWLLSKESIASGGLDEWATRVGKKVPRTPIDKELLSKFLEWRLKLSKDISNKHKYSTEEVDEFVQKILIRLLFIKNCEDRDFETNYKLLPAVETYKIHKKGLLKLLRRIFDYYDETYDSSIFENGEVDKISFDESLLSEILNGLHFTSDGLRYNFNVIPADVMGRLYEQYLGHILKKTPQTAKLKEGKAHRKEQGIYYTPTYIVDYIVKNTLGELLKNKKVDASKIRVLDPACGSGSFLVKAFDVLNEHYSKDKTYGHGQQTLAGYSIKEKILKNSIFGVDLDKQAAEIAQLNLLLRIAEKGQKLPLLQQNIKIGNSLIEDPAVAGDKAFKWEDEFKDIIDNGGFDVVIGNPPYVKARDTKDPKSRKFMETCGKFETLYKMWDIYIAFVEKGIKLLKPNGCFAMIIPDTIGEADYTTKLVELIIKKYSLYQIDFFPDIEVFSGVGVRNKIIFVKNSIKVRKCKRVLHDLRLDNVKDLGMTDNRSPNVFRLVHSKINFDFRSVITLDKICYVSYGARFNSDKNDKIKFKKEDLISNVKDKIHNKVYTEGKYISRYSINKEIYVEWDTERCPKRLVRPTFPQLYPPNKLLMSRQKRIATYSNKGHVCDNTIIVGVPYHELIGVENKGIKKYLQNIKLNRKYAEENSKKYDIKYLLAIINSKLIRYFLKINSRSKIDSYPDDWKKIPIREISDKEQKTLIDIVDKMLSLKKHLNELKDKTTDEKSHLEKEINKTDAEIDELVYKIYGITEEEKKVIEESLK